MKRNTKREVVRLLDEIIQILEGPLTHAMMQEGWIPSTQQGMLSFYRRQRNAVEADEPNELWDAFRGLDYAGVDRGVVPDLTEQLRGLMQAEGE